MEILAPVEEVMLKRNRRQGLTATMYVEVATVQRLAVHDLGINCRSWTHPYLRTRSTAQRQGIGFSSGRIQRCPSSSDWQSEEAEPRKPEYGNGADWRLICLYDLAAVSNARQC